MCTGTQCANRQGTSGAAQAMEEDEANTMGKQSSQGTSGAAHLSWHAG